MKKAKRLLAMILAFVMLCSAACIPTYGYVASSDNYYVPSVGADGKYSQSYETFSTKEAPKTADIAVEKVRVVEDGDKYVVTVSVTGATKALAYNIAGNENNLKYFENKLATVHGH